ncbi:MAG: hypothetical protein LIP16_01670 [Clostridium sp.]|nr:hypothetical protein [Clostridium sp.]
MSTDIIPRRSGSDQREEKHQTGPCAYDRRIPWYAVDGGGERRGRAVHNEKR